MTAAILRFALTAFCAITLAASAFAGQIIGGHDETSENLPATWAVTLPTPGVAPAGAASHLLLTEIVVTPTGGEYIEIANPTGSDVSLDGYYVTDDWFSTGGTGYFQLPQAGYTVGVSSDFDAHFPPGAMIPAGGVITVASSGADFTLTYGFPPTYELNDTSPVANMVIVSNNTPLSLALLTNSSEMVMLFYWDGATDLVCDVDYVQWGSLASGNGVDKTGKTVDGPDGDAVASAYNADTPVGSQTFVPAPASGESVARTGLTEVGETATGGNGCIPDGNTSTRRSTWGQLKVRYR